MEIVANQFYTNILLMKESLLEPTIVCFNESTHNALFNVSASNIPNAETLHNNLNNGS